jgi:hypothetical protein
LIDVDFQEFLEKIDLLGYGVAIMNTYHQGGENRFYIQISEKGSTGKFHKRENKANELNQNLDFMFEMLRRTR